jgi:hypothetical protein
MTNKIELCQADMAYISNRILEELGDFVDRDGNTDEYSKPGLMGIIENAIDDLNQDRT